MNVKLPPYFKDCTAVSPIILLALSTLLYTPLSWSIDLNKEDEVTMQLIEFDELNELSLQSMTRISLPKQIARIPAKETTSPSLKPRSSKPSQAATPRTPEPR